MAVRRAAPRHRQQPDALAATVGGRIRKLRQEQGFSFDAFVEETGLGRGYISELERGMVVPTITALAKVAAALELTLADLVLGNSVREQLFDIAKQLPETTVRALLAEADRLAQSGKTED